MYYKDLFSILTEYFDKERCYEFVADIYENDRWFSFSKFEKTAAYVAEKLQHAGLTEVEMLPLKADGHTAYGDWVIPRAWDVDRAALRVVQPEYDNSVLADYCSIPASLIMYSAATPHGGVSAEAVIVDSPEEVEPGSVKDKIIFTSGRPQTVLKLAVENGAAGIVSDFLPMYDGVRKREDVMDTFRWENDMICPVNDTGLFFFSLSPRHGDRLRGLITAASREGQRVVLHAEVDTRFYDGINYTVSGLIPGTHPQGEEVLICGHLYEPGANDNASGCGAMLELAVSLQNAITDGRLSRPYRGIRFVMGFECAGLAGYCATYPEKISKMVGAIDMDMVGAADCDRAVMHYWHNPLSSWSYMDTLIISLAREYMKYSADEFTFVETHFMVGDNILADPMFDVPTTAAIMHPALSYHSSIDTMDKVDPGILKRNGIIAGAYVYFMALPEEDNIRWLLAEIREHAERVVKQKEEKDNRKAYLLGNAFFNGCLSLKKLAEGMCRELLQEIDETADNLPKPVLSGMPILQRDNILYGKLVPERITPGCLTFLTMPAKEWEKTGWKPFYNYELNCPLFWTDGKRNLWEITCLTAYELGKDPESLFAELREYYMFLEKQVYVRFLA